MKKYIVIAIIGLLFFTNPIGAQQVPLNGYTEVTSVQIGAFQNVLIIGRVGLSVSGTGARFVSGTALACDDDVDGTLLAERSNVLTIAGTGVTLFSTSSSIVTLPIQTDSVLTCRLLVISAIYNSIGEIKKNGFMTTNPKLDVIILP